MFPTPENREELNRTNAELKKYYLIEKEFWRQKARLRCFEKGDRNTKFFHSYVKGRRRKLNISEIQIEQGDRICLGKNIKAEAVAYYERQFKDASTEDYSMLDCIPHLVIEMQNDELTEVPEVDEVKGMVFL